MPACALPSMPRPGGLPASTSTSEVPAGESLEAALQRHLRRGLARTRARQHQIHQGALAFPAAVEQRQPAVAMAEEAHHRRHAVDRGDQLGRRAALGRAQRGTHVDQVAQHRDLQVRRALGDDAVMRDVALHEPGEPREISARGSSRNACRRAGRQVGEDHRLHHLYGLVADQPGARDTTQMGALAAERQHEPPREGLVGGSGQPVVVADPVTMRDGHHVALPALGRPAPFALDPVVDEVHGERRRGGIAAVTQVAQPGEAVQGVEPQRRRAFALPRRIGALRRHRADLAMGQQLAHRATAARPPDRPARDRARRRRSSWGCDGRASGNKTASPAATDRIGSGTGVPRLGERGSGWAGTRPPTDHRTGGNSATSVILLLAFGPALVAELLRGG